MGRCSHLRRHRCRWSVLEPFSLSEEYMGTAVPRTPAADSSTRTARSASVSRANCWRICGGSAASVPPGVRQGTVKHECSAAICTRRRQLDDAADKTRSRSPGRPRPGEATLLIGVDPGQRPLKGPGLRFSAKARAASWKSSDRYSFSGAVCIVTSRSSWSIYQRRVRTVARTESGGFFATSAASS